MRTIKFRGKRVDNGEWAYGSYSLMKGTSKMLIDRSASNSDDWIYKDMTFEQHLISDFIMPDYQGWDYSSQCRFHKVDSKTVGQFTGLLDKNGKEIYEGDILKTLLPDTEGGMEETISQVDYYGSGFVIDETYPLDCFHSAGEIIGNIYENSELLIL